MCCFVTPVQVNLSAYCYVCSGLFISTLLCLFRSVYQCAVIFVRVSLSSLLLRSVYQYAVKFVQVSLSVCFYVCSGQFISVLLSLFRSVYHLAVLFRPVYQHVILVQVNFISIL